MSSHKRRGEDDRNQRAGGDKRRRRRNRKHLYLVLDDWKKGFSIHKIDADSFDSDSESDEHHHSGDAWHLPEPPALRLEPPTGDESHSQTSFAALGAKIIAFMNQRCGLVYDAEAAVLSVGAHAPTQMSCSFDISVAVGEVLYVLAYNYKQPYSFEAMSWGPTGPDARKRPTEGWLWKTLPPPPFTSRRHVHSYALHPDGRTIFVTSPDDDKDCMGGLGTYSFDTMDSVWKFHGKWALPFHGQGHFDSELDAWVGLNSDGYMCCCPVISPSFFTTDSCFYPDCKMTEDRMFSKRDMLASLTYMGASKFCLVECVGSKNVKKGPIYGARDGFVIHLTMFGLKYNHRGELQIKGHRSTRSFAVSRHRYCFSPHAFWM